MKIAIIGTAGRKQPITRALWDKIKLKFWSSYYEGTLFASYISLDKPDIEWVSGGAAGIDHLAVRFCNTEYSSYDKLTLHLPCTFDLSSCRYSKGKVGDVANYYHERFSRNTGLLSLLDIKQAIEKGAHVTVSPGFYSRNILVGQADVLLAMTFGTKSGIYGPETSSTDAGLSDGGTAHTWNNSKASRKIHVNLNDLG